MDQSPAVDWSSLPADILIRITRDAGNAPAEIIAFRSVCQWWRLSIPLPPNKLSAIFPLYTPVYPAKLEQKDGSCLGCGIQFVFYASAVYLVRPRSDPSGPACLVSIEESSPGNLVLRDPLVFRQLFTSPPPPPIDLDWIVASQTRFSRSFSSCTIYSNCHTLRWTKRMVYVPYSAFGCRGLVGVFQSGLGYWVFKMDLIGNISSEPPAFECSFGARTATDSFPSKEGNSRSVDPAPDDVFPGHNIAFVSELIVEIFSIKSTMPRVKDDWIFRVIKRGDHLISQLQNHLPSSTSSTLASDFPYGLTS